MAIYMDLDGVKGDVTESGHVGQVELLEAHWGVARLIRDANGVGKNRESGSLAVGQYTVVKYIDSASHAIMDKAFVGQAQRCKIDFTRVDEGKEAVYRTIELTDTIVSSVNLEGANKDRAREIVTLNFLKIEISDETEGGKGDTDTTARTGYDLVQAKKI